MRSICENWRQRALFWMLMLFSVYICGCSAEYVSEVFFAGGASVEEVSVFYASPSGSVGDAFCYACVKGRSDGTGKPDGEGGLELS